MAAPIVTWTLGEDDTTLNAWNMGRVNAGDDAAEMNVHIWNNMGGQEDVSDMQDTQITTVADDPTLDTVKDKWIKVRNLSTPKDEHEDSTYYSIGDVTTHTITAQDCEEGIISGKANNGLRGDMQNYADVLLGCTVPANAPAGARKLYTRVIYYYT